METDYRLHGTFIWVFFVLTELSKGPAGKSKQDCWWYKASWVYRPNGKTDLGETVAKTLWNITVFLLVLKAMEDEINKPYGHHMHLGSISLEKLNP